ncbi:MAG: hypothetical protein JSW71_19470 [Gemmatimonadota bacterium]|nr:MAG: hypothetical protein JSW71_19470 [Gemmatimonadota bacterium]
MKRIIIIVIIILLSLLVSCSADAPSTPEHEAHFTAATAPLPYLLPERTLLAVEIYNLAGRWSEIRAIQALARFQDKLLAGTAIRPDQLPLVAGRRLVLALVAGSRTIMPLAVLLPPDMDSAEPVLRSLGPNWSVVRARGALWVAPSNATDELEIVAAGDGSSLARVVPLQEADRRLPAGGLARGWVNPAALKQLLRSRVEGKLSGLIDAVGGLLSAELEAVRWIGFRRELEAGRIVTDAITVYDTRVLPREVARVLDPAATPATLPVPLPETVVMAAAFRPEPQVALPWLQFLAERNTAGPLRNVEFWIEEFEEWSNRILADDLFGAIGEQAWLLVLDSRSTNSPSWTLILQAPQSHRAEATLLDLLDWSVEQAWARTLGLAVPRIRDYRRDGITIHEVAIRTPFGEVAGPVFAAVDGFLVAAAGEESLQTGFALVAGGALAGGVGDHEQSFSAHASFWARGTALAGLVESSLVLCDVGEHCNTIMMAAAELLANVSFASAQARYEADAMRMHGEILLHGSR